MRKGQWLELLRMDQWPRISAMQWWVHGHCNHKNLFQKGTRSDIRLHVLGNTHDHLQSNISIWQGEQSCFTGNFWWVMASKGESTVRAMATCFGSLGYTCLQLKIGKSKVNDSRRLILYPCQPPPLPTLLNITKSNLILYEHMALIC